MSKKKKSKDSNGSSGLVIALSPLDRGNLKELQAKYERLGCTKKMSEIASDAVKIGIKELLK